MNDAGDYDDVYIEIARSIIAELRAILAYEYDVLLDRLLLLSKEKETVFTSPEVIRKAFTEYTEEIRRYRESKRTD